MEKDIDIYNSQEKCIIKAKLFYFDENKNSKNFFIFCHGFCSGKGSNSVKIVANKLLEYGINSISFDFPGHIDSKQGADKLKLNVCISYIDSVIYYLKKQFGQDINISFFAISFGAFVLLNKLIEDSLEYNNIVLRSPAINMKEIFINCLLKESFEQYKINGKAKAGKDGKIEVSYEFYEDLIKNDLYSRYNEKRKILIIHGELDDTAPIKDIYKFIEKRPEIELIEMKNMKHHMEPDEIEIITQTMINNLDIKKLT